MALHRTGRSYVAEIIRFAWGRAPVECVLNPAACQGWHKPLRESVELMYQEEAKDSCQTEGS